MACDWAFPETTHMLRLIGLLALIAGVAILVMQYGTGQMAGYRGPNGNSYLATTVGGAILLLFGIVAFGKSGSTTPKRRK